MSRYWHCSLRENDGSQCFDMGVHVAPDGLRAKALAEKKFQGTMKRLVTRRYYVHVVEVAAPPASPPRRNTRGNNPGLPGVATTTEID